MSKRITLGITTAACAAAAAAFAYCGGEVDEPSSATETSAGGVPMSAVSEPPTAGNVEAKADAAKPFEPPAPPLLEKPKLQLPGPPCGDCPREPQTLPAR